MALPNYSPEGAVSFGSVPWDSSYRNVRLYANLDEQYRDISSMMDITSTDYAYIGHNRKLKVQIPADRLYSCNYCTYINSSIGGGRVYCFVRDVEYVNINTSAVTLETDLFQTFLYGVDWTVPPCFIERETVAHDTKDYWFSSEPDFPLTYTIAATEVFAFRNGGYVVMSASKPERNQNIIDDVLNPSGYYAKPAGVSVYKGTPNGGVVMYYPVDTSGGASEGMEAFLNGLQFAGSIDSVTAIFSIPDFMATTLFPGEQRSPIQDFNVSVQKTVNCPPRGDDVDGYRPRNGKLLAYPYNFMRLTDMCASKTDLRYELMGSTEIGIKTTLSPSCQAIVYPRNYQGSKSNYEVGLTVPCGSMGSWSSNAFTTWLANNTGSIVLSVAGAALAGAAGAVSLTEAGAALMGTKVVKGVVGGIAKAAGVEGVKDAVATGAGFAGSALNASKQPTVTKGQTDMNFSYCAGMQGIQMERVCVKAEVAKQIDDFFSRFGYAVERVGAVNVTSRPSWNYIKTQGCAPRSAHAAAGTVAPFTRGRGTPASVLDAIGDVFDGGVTFWHTTDGFGDFSRRNEV